MANERNGASRGAAVRQKQMMPMAGEDEPTFMARCEADPGMVQAHPDSAERQMACSMSWDAAEGDMGDMMDAAPNTIQRAYSVLNVKSLSEEQRIVHGIATTPSTDRVGDIVESEGADFNLPLPFLMHHDSRLPVGNVIRADVTKSGINVQIQLAKIAEPGILKDRVDTAWQEFKAGLIRGLSIGFSALEREPITGTKGIRFKRWAWHELSGVTVPANQGATVTMIRSLDTQSLAALGKDDAAETKTKPPGVSGKSTSISLKPERSTKMNLTDQIPQLEQQLGAKIAQMEGVLGKSAEEGRTPDEQEDDEVATLEREIDAIGKNLKQLRTLETLKSASARPVTGTTKSDGSNSRELRTGTDGYPHIVVKREEELPKGIAFARYVMCLASARGNLWQASEIAKGRYGANSDLAVVLKSMSTLGTTGEAIYKVAAVAGAVTSDAQWAGPLVSFYPRWAGDFVEYLRPQTILGRFGTGGIPSLRRVPFNINIAGQTTGSTASWVGEGKGKPVVAWQYGSTNLGWCKAAAITVLTEELLRFSSPSAEALVRDELAAALINQLDVDFIDPSKVVAAGTSPASITNGATSHLSSGNYGDAVRADVATLLGGFIGANIAPTNAVFIMSATKALALSLLRNALGQPEFPDINMNGGMLEGIPVITSQYIGELAHTGGEIMVLVNASDVWLADDGQVTVDASREASIEMVDLPTEDASGGVAAAMVSMWQTNSIAVRCERYINWAKRRAQGVQVMSNVFYGGVGASGT